MNYVDGFVIPVPKKNLAAYRKMAAQAARVWKDHGALAFCETVGDDLKMAKARSFPSMVKSKPGEAIVFSWIVYKSKAQRDRVNKKIMKDPRLLKMMKDESPFDVKRMAYGGFKVIVAA